MIVDFQHHFTPRELFKEDLGDKLVIVFDETGATPRTSCSTISTSTSA
jgi:hypothetical protein